MSIAIVLVVPSGGTSLGLGALVAGLLPEGVSLLMVNAVVAGLVDAALQGVLVGFGAKEFSIAEVISTSFAVAGAGWAGRAGGGAAAAKGIADYNFELTVESGIRVLSANIAEQLTLMAAGQQHHLDFKQAAAVMLGAGIDPQLAKVTNKFTPGIKPFASNVMHTVSGAAINGALRGRIDLEQVAAQMLSNTISTAITPALMNGLAWTESHVFNAQAARQHAEVMHQKPKPVQKKRHVNASKDNVHRLPAAQTNELALSPQAFMRQLGIEGLYSDLNEVMRDLLFTENEQYASYIPSIEMPTAKPLNVMESFLTTVNAIDSEFHLTEMAANMRFVAPNQTPSLLDRMANSGFVTAVNKAGYATYQFVDWVNHEFNPLITVPRHGKSAYNKLMSGNMTGSLVETGYMIIDGIPLAPAAKVITIEAKALGSAAKSRFGFFSGGSGSSAGSIGEIVPNTGLRGYIERTSKLDYSPISTVAEKDFGYLNQATLTPAQQAVVNKMSRILRDHAKPHDFTGVVKELSGQKIRKPGGGYYNHVKEMVDTVQGIDNQLIKLEGMLKNPRLLPENRAVLENTWHRGNEALRQMHSVTDVEKYTFRP